MIKSCVIACGSLYLTLYLVACCFGTVSTVSSDDNGAFVKIYAGRSFQGRQREIYIENNKCFPLFGDWAVITQSIKFDDKTCIQIYEGGNCEGRSSILRGQSQNDRSQGANLESIGFDRKVQSIRLC